MVDYTFIEGSLDEVISRLGDVNTFSLDLETTGLSALDSRIILCQVGVGSSVYVIDASRASIAPLRPFLEDDRWLKLIQNAKFEQEFILHHQQTEINNVFDTKLAEHLITSNESWQSTSLKTIAKKYTDVDLDKEITKSFIDMKPVEAFSSEQLDYAAKDAEILFPIYEAQKAKLDELGLNKIAEIEFELAGVVANMELTGVPIDKKEWERKLKEYIEKHEASRLKMHELLFDGTDHPDEQIGMFVRDSINLNSHVQLKKAFAKIGIDLESTDERVISLVNHPAAKELLNYKEYAKVLSTYGVSFLEKIHPFTGRVHASFQQMGTATGRFSCKEPNLQNLPEPFRECVSLADHKLITADYSQIELRILGELSKDEKFMTAFKEGNDLHTQTASYMFNIPYDKVNKEQRFQAKTLNFGISYGMGPTKLMDMLNAGKPESEHLGFHKVAKILYQYRDTYKDVTKWLRMAGERAYRQGYSETMMGRKRFFTVPTTGQTGEYDAQIAGIKRQGANAPIQGTNADITKLAMLNIYRDLKEYKIPANIIIQVHDEIVVLSHNRYATNVKDIVVQSMTKAAEAVIKTVPIKIDAYISDIWSKGG